MRDSGYGLKPGSLRSRHLISAPLVAPGPELSTSGPTSLSIHACLFIGSIRPPFSIIRRDSSNCMLVVWFLKRPRACLLLSPLRTFSRRHASMSDSRVGFLLLMISFTRRHCPLLKVSRRLRCRWLDRYEDRRRIAHLLFFPGYRNLVHLLPLSSPKGLMQALIPTAGTV